MRKRQSGLLELVALHHKDAATEDTTKYIMTKFSSHYDADHRDKDKMQRQCKRCDPSWLKRFEYRSSESKLKECVLKFKFTCLQQFMEIPMFEDALLRGSLESGAVDDSSEITTYCMTNQQAQIDRELQSGRRYANDSAIRILLFLLR